MPKGVYKRTAPVDRFWIKVHKTDACWEWTASVFQHGLPYGQFQLNGRPHLAHRIAWTFVNGPVPTGLSVLHRCDNPRCVNHDHLFLGTSLDNNRDMTAKKRHPKTGKLSDEQRREIKEAVASGPRGTTRRLAVQYGVSETTISYVAKGRRKRIVS